MPATDRYTRHIGIAHQLRTRSWVSATSLATRYGVSVRTIYRDIEQLTAAGLPIESVAGREGGYRLGTEGGVDPLLLDADDALRLYVLGLIDHDDDESAAAPPLTSRGVSTYARDTLRRLSQRIYFDTTDWYWRDEGSGHVPAIRYALLTNSAVEITVRAKRSVDPNTLVVKPYGLVWKGGEWWLVAALTSGQPQRYRLNHVDRVDRTDLRFIYPEDDFSLRLWWSQALEAYGRGPNQVVLRVELAAREEMLRLCLKPDSEVRHHNDGRVLITLYVDEWHWLVPLVASFGADVAVLEPAALRADLAAHHARALAAYAEVEPLASPPADFRNDDSRLRSTRGRNPITAHR